MVINHGRFVSGDGAIVERLFDANDEILVEVIASIIHTPIISSILCSFSPISNSIHISHKSAFGNRKKRFFDLPNISFRWSCGECGH
ncbi:hypothetical protein RvY_19454 [Ramazzottius varieornatus]|uniref:Uncharacterized protein n=1 Tax=Ramazzottius varieornatus TaxID=947166 RepID=A0A1D1W9D9_RAMVA|nr:hypothetical protein RvY_19454 [Ramazzottius varieornatus]